MQEKSYTTYLLAARGYDLFNQQKTLFELHD
jgi:hypothetical protein